MSKCPVQYDYIEPLAFGGTLGLLWNRVNGAWKIIAYQPIRQ